VLDRLLGWRDEIGRRFALCRGWRMVGWCGGGEKGTRDQAGREEMNLPQTHSALSAPLPPQQVEGLEAISVCVLGGVAEKVEGVEFGD
jgi:hypothetical protein